MLQGNYLQIFPNSPSGILSCLPLPLSPSWPLIALPFHPVL